ncbi:lysosome-associated membrane glycoprotein 5-like [Saccoglossus kowalevskii]
MIGQSVSSEYGELKMSVVSCLGASVTPTESSPTEAPSSIAKEDLSPEPTMGDDSTEGDNDDESDDVTPPAAVVKETSPANVEVETTEESAATTESPIEQTTEPSVPKVGNFSLKDKNGNICLKAVFAAWFECGYYSGDESSPTFLTTLVPMFDNSRVDGKCGDIYEQSILNIRWGGDKYLLKMTFDTDQTNSSKEVGTWFAKSLHFTYDTSDKTYFTDAVNAGSRTVQTYEDTTFFDTPLKQSFMCQTQDNIKMGSEDSEEKVILKISNLQIQPYEVEDDMFSEDPPLEKTDMLNGCCRRTESIIESDLS